MLCVLILVFIFLAPKEWLSSGERPRVGEHQSPIATMILTPELVANEADRGQIEQRIRTLTGRPKVEVLDVRKVFGSDGKVVSFEVDIR